MAPSSDPEQRRPPDLPGRGAGKAGAMSVSLFLFALLMLMPPILMLVEDAGDLFHVPVVYIFLFSVWIAVVGAIYLIAERVRRPDEPGE
ncbi:MAG: hypothetical protein RIE87_16980 [Rhodospirillales bacterium]